MHAKTYCAADEDAHAPVPHGLVGRHGEVQVGSEAYVHVGVVVPVGRVHTGATGVP